MKIFFFFFFKIYKRSIFILNFNTNNVSDMSYMFSSCSSLKELNLSKFNFSNVKDRTGMFSLTPLLTKLILPQNELMNNL